MMRYLCLLFLLIWPQIALPVEEKLQTAIPYAKEQANRIGYIAIEDKNNAISQATWIYVRNALEYYKKNKPIFIILELNTPGGEVFAAEQISDALRDFDTNEHVPIVAFVNNWAISAGALLAYSCRFIAAAKDASMGGAQPVVMSAEGQTQAASEKVNSVLRADFANRARFFDRNPDIAEAMVDADIILVLRQGKVIRVDSESQIRSDDTVISPKGKLLTLNAQQMMQFGVADFLVAPASIIALTSEEMTSGHWPATKSALFQAPFFKDIPQAEIDAYRMDWKTQFFAWLASPMISSALFLGLMLGLYFEFSSPGFGLAGGLGLLCLFLILLSTYSLQLASYLELIFLVSGLLLLAVELLLFPSGLLGLMGGVLFLMGLFGILIPELNSVNFDWDLSKLGLVGEVVLKRVGWLSLAVILGALVILLVGRFVTPRFAGIRRLVLSGGEQTNFMAADPEQEVALGTEGRTMSVLRPAGKVQIGGQLYDAVSTGDYIDNDRPVRVMGFDAAQLIVEEIR